jgi:hypothetical protein
MPAHVPPSRKDRRSTPSRRLNRWMRLLHLCESLALILALLVAFRATPSEAVGNTYSWTNPTDFDTASNTFAAFTTTGFTIDDSTSQSATGHSHGGSVDLYIDVFDTSTSTWVEVWNTSTLGEYFFHGVSASFTQRTISGIQVRSNPAQFDTFHGWYSVVFNFSNSPQGPGITVNPTSGLATTEAGSTATFTVVLNSAPSDDVTIPLSSSNTAEGTVSPSSLTFTTSDWNTPQTVTATGVDDSVDDGNVAYSIVTGAATSNDSGYNSLDPADVGGSNADDDTAGVTVSGISNATTETGGTASFSVVLNSQPTADVTIGLSSSDTTEGTVSPSSLTFTAADWNTPQSATVTGANDDIDDGDIIYNIVTAAATSTDSNYSNRNAADVPVINQDDDTAGITVSSISGNTSEAGGTASFDVTLASQPTADVTIGLSSSDTGEGTVSPSSLTFTTSDWNTPQTVTATGVDDAIDDGDVAYKVVIAAASSSDTVYNGINADDVDLSNTDNDSAGFVVSNISGDTSEAGGTASFTVKLNSQPTADVMIGLSNSDPTEGAVSPASLTFTSANWNAPQTVTVTGQDDAVDDGDIAYSIVTKPAVSQDGNYNNQNPADVPVTNQDDDTAGITVSAISGNTTEAGGIATFTVVLDSEPTDDVVVTLNSSDSNEGTVDPVSLTFTSANWDTEQTVTVNGADDSVDDGDVGYTIVTDPASSADGNYDLLNPDDVNLVNIDDDTAGVTVSPISGDTGETGGTATFTLKLNSQPIDSVSVALSSDDVSEGTVSPTTLTFDATNWNTPQAATVTGQDDSVDDGDVAYAILIGVATSNDGNYNGADPADVNVTNVDDDTAGISVSSISGNTSEAGGTATFDMVLDSQPTANVTIQLSSSDTGEGTVSPASLTFTASNWNAPQSATVTGVNDAVDDGDIAYSIVTKAATSSDSKYGGMNPADVDLFNTDDDGAGVVVSALSGDTSEAGGTATFSVRLASQPTANVTIPLSSSDPSEGTVSPASLTFTSANWNTQQTVTVNGVNDNKDDGDIAYQVVIGAATSTDTVYNGQNAADLPVTNLDDDTAGIIISAASGDTSEAGGTAIFTVKLATEPDATVTIDLSSSDTGEGTVSPASLTFAAGNWNAAQTVTVTGVDDEEDDGDSAYTIVIAPASSTDTNYDQLNAGDVSLSNVDDDDSGVGISPITFDPNEAGGTATFTMKLNSQPTADVNITLELQDGTVVLQGATSLIAVAGNAPLGVTMEPTVLTFTPSNWDTPQTVTVTGIGNNTNLSVAIASITSADPTYNGQTTNEIPLTPSGAARKLWLPIVRVGP